MSAPSGKPIIGIDLLPAAVEAVSLYVHIPFCSSRCNYCDFYFETTRSPRVIQATLERILEEAEFLLSAMGRPTLRSVYFGGGTPSIVPPPLLDAFLSRFTAIVFQTPVLPGLEWTFEANPESVDERLLEILLRHGINRLSLGVQSFNDGLLQALTRRADGERVRSALRAVKSVRRGVEQFGLNIDLITGIPRQTREQVRSDVKEAVDSGVDHFSVYSLTIEEHTPLKQAIDKKIRRLPTPSQQDGLWLCARDAIQAAGFEWYEISNFARPGRRSQHNIGYWRLEPYLGVGPGGVSTIRVSEGNGTSARPVRLTNPNLFIYSSQFDRDWHHEVEELGPQALLFEHFITGLRTSMGVSLGRLERIFAVDLAELWRERLDKWVSDGITARGALRSDDPTLLLTPRARLALDHYLLEIESWIEALPELPPPAWPLQGAGAS
ncbi:MAG TPA: radical SAM family heme chaperone HemW [Spirochaetia bacterium]|nr:radical SAM family heme chaperone HemW [Spirochaetia bacterium]